VFKLKRLKLWDFSLFSKSDMAAVSTQVVKVTVDQIRPKYANLEAWMQDPNNVYIGRRGVVLINKRRFPPQDSIFANPFKVEGDDDLSRYRCVMAYSEYITKRLNTEPALVEELKKLRGKTLGCWCKPKMCHGDVLISLIAQLS
jgi:hypothetical protein